MLMVDIIEKTLPLLLYCDPTVGVIVGVLHKKVNLSVSSSSLEYNAIQLLTHSVYQNLYLTNSFVCDLPHPIMGFCQISASIVVYAALANLLIYHT